MAGSHGLYDNLFAELKDQIFRMGYATFCSTSGAVTIPSIGDIYLNRLVTFDEDGNPIFDWQEIEEWLSRNYTELSPNEFTALGDIFALLMIHEDSDIGDIERFLNAMARPFPGTIIDAPIVELDFWHFCPNLVDGIMRAINARINEWTILEHISMGTSYRDIIQGERHMLMQGLGLLYLLSGNSPLSEWANVNGNGVNGLIFTGDSNGAGLRILSDRYGNFFLQFTPLPTLFNVPEGTKPWDSIPAGLHINHHDPIGQIQVYFPLSQTATIAVITGEGRSSADFLVNFVADRERAIHTESRLDRLVKDVGSFGLGMIPIKRAVKIGIEVAKIAVNQLAFDEVNDVMKSIDAMRDIGLRTNEIAYYVLDIIFIEGPNDSFTYIPMPSAITIDREG